MTPLRPSLGRQKTVEAQLCARLNPRQATLTITAAIASTRATQRTAARIEPRIRASNKTATATVKMPRTANSSLKRCQTPSGRDPGSAPDRLERTIWKRLFTSGHSMRDVLVLANQDLELTVTYAAGPGVKGRTTSKRNPDQPSPRPGPVTRASHRKVLPSAERVRRK